MEIKSYLNEQRGLVEEAFDSYLPAAEGVFRDHIEALRYSLLAGGKRVRPILCLATARAVAGDSVIEEDLLPLPVPLNAFTPIH